MFLLMMMGMDHHGDVMTNVPLVDDAVSLMLSCTSFPLLFGLHIYAAVLLSYNDPCGTALEHT